MKTILFFYALVLCSMLIFVQNHNNAISKRIVKRTFPHSYSSVKAINAFYHSLNKKKKTKTNEKKCRASNICHPNQCCALLSQYFHSFYLFISILHLSACTWSARWSVCSNAKQSKDKLWQRHFICE